MWLAIALVACRPEASPGPHPPLTEPTATTGDTAATSTTEVAPFQFNGELPKSVLMVSIDTLRKDHLDRYGGPGIAPYLDSLMREGVSLDDHTQCSNWTYAGTSCVLLGRSHLENGLIPQLSQRGREPFPDGTEFLATWLAEAGFYTVIASSNGWLSSEWNNVQGYAVELPSGGTTSALMRRGLAHIKEQQPDRWFLHIHVTEPHAPYDPPEMYLADLEGLPEIRWDLSDKDITYEATGSYPQLNPQEQDALLAHLGVRYRGEIAWFDDQLAATMKEFDDAGLLDDTLVVMWSDHGEQHFDHGEFSHAFDLYREENDAMAFFWAKSLQARSWSGPTHATDLAPTILDLMGVPVPEVVSGEVVGAAPRDRPRFAMSMARSGAVQSVIQGKYKLIFDWNEGLELYGPGDVGEEAPSSDLERAAELWALLEPKVERGVELLPDERINWPSLYDH